MMNKPESLQEYLLRINLMRRKEFFLFNENRNAPTPISLQNDDKIDQLIIQILEFVKHLIGEGPLFTKFEYMMINLHKTFKRELSEFHHVSVSNKVNSDKKYIDEVKKANEKLTEYIRKCETQKEEAEKRLDTLVYQNKDIRRLPSNPILVKESKPVLTTENKVEIEDNFDDDDIVLEQPVKIQKFDKGNLVNPSRAISNPSRTNIENPSRAITGNNPSRAVVGNPSRVTDGNPSRATGGNPSRVTGSNPSRVTGGNPSRAIEINPPRDSKKSKPDDQQQI